MFINTAMKMMIQEMGAGFI